ncbi:MAG: tyrosine-type recombinase/integrase [Vicinamibacterales bacterium]
MPIAHFTDDWIKKLRVATRVDFFDDRTTGFVLRAGPSGAKTWGLFYRATTSRLSTSADGTTRATRPMKRYRIGDYPTLTLGEAREIAKTKLLALAATGADPAVEKHTQRRATTFDTLADWYIDQYAKPRKRSWANDGRQLRVFCRPLWRDRAASDLTREDIRALLLDVATSRGGVSANRLHSLLSKLFRWSVAQGYLDANPMAGLPKPAAERSRERVLSDTEIKALWNELDAKRALPEDDPAHVAPTIALWLKIRVLTGQRGGEVASMQWSHVNLTTGVWEIPGALRKNRQPHVVPLGPWVCGLLTEWRQQQRPDARFVLDGGRGRHARAGIVGAITSIRDWTPHDLRRTCATGMARLGTDRFIIARVLGHVDPSVTSIYDRFERLNEKRGALDAWAEHVGTLVGALPKRRGRVISMARRGRA